MTGIPPGPSPGSTVRASRRDLALFAVVAMWVPLVLVADVGVGIWTQRALGAGTWALLLVLMRSESPRTRAQVAIVVGYATVIEYTCSPLLGAYTYRLHNVPAFVPPGHGLVYFAALALGRSPLLALAGRRAALATLAVGGAYAAWGLTYSPRLDVLGAVWLGCLALFLLRGRAPLVYAAAFVIVTYLELIGTGLGTWTWAGHDPTGLLAVGNPPSGAAGGYCFFDAAALTLAGPVLARWQRMAGRWRRARLPGQSSASSASAASQASLRAATRSRQCAASSAEA